MYSVWGLQSFFFSTYALLPLNKALGLIELESLRIPHLVESYNEHILSEASSWPNANCSCLWANVNKNTTVGAGHWCDTGLVLSRGSKEATMSMTSSESFYVEKSTHSKHPIRKMQCLSFHQMLLYISDFLACIELFVVDGIARGEKSLNLVLCLFFISLRVASILTYLSCLKAV